MRFLNVHHALISWLWIGWVLYWWTSAVGAKATERRESLWSRLAHLGPLAVGMMLIASQPVPWAWLSTRVLPDALATYWIGVALVVVGLGFSIWARQHLGRNWSATVTIKEGHDLIRTGPYRWVRHPIYTGLLAAVLGCAIARGDLQGVLGLAIVAASFVRKLRIEERWMEQRFKAEYERYRAEVPALIPRVF